MPFLGKRAPGLLLHLTIVIVAGRAGAEPRCSSRCEMALIDDACHPHVGPYTPDDEIKVHLTCHQTCRDRGQTWKSPRFVERHNLPKRIWQKGCRYPSPVHPHPSQASCQDGEVFAFASPGPGKHRLDHRFDLTILGDGSTTCPPPPPAVRARLRAEEKQRQELEARSEARKDAEWDRVRKSWGSELATGGTATWGDRDAPYGFVGAEVRMGPRLTRDFELGGGGGEFSISKSKGARWCMPVLMCGAIGVLFAPESSFVGNEHGFDVVGRVDRALVPGNDSLTGAVGLRPHLRVAADDRLRTQSLVGVFAPELGFNVAPRELTGFYAKWHLYPVDVLLSRHVALSWDGPVIGVAVPFHGNPVTATVSSSLSVSGLFDHD